MNKYDELKQLASGLPAPWVTDADEPNIWHPKIRYPGDDGAFCGPIAELYSNLNLAASDPRMHLQMKQMAKFIAAANPAAILELIAENERLQAEVQETKHEVEILEREVSEYEGHSLLIDAVCYRLGRDVGEGMFGPSRLQRTFLLCHGNAVRLLNLLTKRGRLEQVEDGGCMRRIAGKGGQANV